MRTNEYAVQNENGVLDVLEGLPYFSSYVPQPTVKEAYLYEAWTRPTIGWSL